MPMSQENLSTVFQCFRNYGSYNKYKPYIHVNLTSCKNMKQTENGSQEGKITVDQNGLKASFTREGHELEQDSELKRKAIQNGGK